MKLYTRNEKGRYSEAPDAVVISEAITRLQTRGMTEITQSLTYELVQSAILAKEPRDG